MKIIDTSAWIEYYRKNGKKKYKTEIRTALKGNICAICGIIKTEILFHTKTKKEFELLDSDLSGIHWFETDKTIYNKASEVGYNLKRKGITIPATDLIIASCALIYKSEIVHLDKHFEKIKTYYPLKTFFYLND